VTAGSRLAAFLGCAAAGSGVAVIGATTTWYRTVGRAQRIDSSIGTIHVGGNVHSYSSGELGSPLPAIALLCLVFALLAYLVGPRARTLLVGSVLAGSAAMVALSFTVPEPIATAAVRQGAAGRFVTPIGAAVALVGAAGALPLSARVRRVRMPETGPAEPE
jgi:hypothetical protein